MRPRSFAPLMARSRKGCAIPSKVALVPFVHLATVARDRVRRRSVTTIFALGMPIYRHAADQSAAGLPNRRRFPWFPAVGVGTLNAVSVQCQS